MSRVASARLHDMRQGEEFSRFLVYRTPDTVVYEILSGLT